MSVNDQMEEIKPETSEALKEDKERKILLWVIFVIVLLLLILGLSFWILNERNKTGAGADQTSAVSELTDVQEEEGDDESELEVDEELEDEPEPEPEPAPADPYEGWRTYTNPNYWGSGWGVTFKYPSDWIVSEVNAQSGLIQAADPSGKYLVRFYTLAATANTCSLTNYTQVDGDSVSYRRAFDASTSSYNICERASDGKYYDWVDVVVDYIAPNGDSWTDDILEIADLILLSKE